MKVTLQLIDTMKSFEVEPGMTIGRSQKCDITIPHESMSSIHAKVIMEYGQLYLEDQGSKNQISYRGHIYRRVPIQHEMILKLGHVIINFHYPQYKPSLKELKEFTTSILQENKIQNNPRDIQLFPRPVELLVIQSPFWNLNFHIHYGPYPVGPHSLMAPLFDINLEHPFFYLSPSQTEGDQIALLETQKTNIQVNGQQISKSTPIFHKDRIEFGETTLSVLQSGRV